MLLTLRTRIHTAQAILRGIHGRHGSLLDTARVVITTLRTNGLRGVRRWLMWEVRLRDTPRRGGRADAVGLDAAALDTFRVHSMADVAACVARLEQRAAREDRYAFEGSARFVVNGYCLACGWGDLVVTDDYGEGRPAWRETAICRCGMNTRMRTVLDWLVNVEAASASARIYCTEATTSFFAAVARRYRNAVGSEYTPESAAPGTVDGRGVRCENLHDLTFADSSFEYVVSLDVLEHVFSYESALRELLRVLKPGGVAIVTVPFRFNQASTVQRARLDGETIEHLLPPIYHSDPVRKDGTLLVYDYGWDFVDCMHRLGWRDIAFIHVWSEPKKYFGRNFILRAVKPAA